METIRKVMPCHLEQCLCSMYLNELTIYSNLSLYRFPERLKQRSPHKSQLQDYL